MIQRAAALNPTNAVPKRVLQISKELGDFILVDQVCWKRFPRGNVEGAILIEADTFLLFVFKLSGFLIKKKYRVLLFDDMRFLPLALFLKLMTGAMLIYNRQEVPTVDASIFLARRFGLPKGGAWKIAESIESFFGRRLDAVLSIPLSADGFARLQAWGHPIASIWNVPELPSTGNVAPRSISSGNSVLLIYSGSISFENGLVSYLRLARRLHDSNSGRVVRLVLIGRMWRITLNELNSLIIKEACQGLVEYHEWVPYDELLTLLAEADIGLALTDPSFVKHSHMGEGASRKVFTYMAVGLPVISGGAFGRVVAENKAGYFVEYDDIDAMFYAAQDIVLNRSMGNALGNNGLLAVQERYNWDCEREKVRMILSEVIQ